MKTALLSSIVLGLVATSAHAFPTVGDQAVYEISSSGTTLETTQEVTAVDSANNTMTLKTTIVIFGRTSSSTHVVDIRQYADNSLPDVCKANNGSFENLTVPAGTFSACHVKQTTPQGTTADVWFAKVAFGIVKSVGTQGPVTQTMILKSQILH